MRIAWTVLLLAGVLPACAGGSKTTRVADESGADRTPQPPITDRYSFVGCEGEIDRENHTLSCPEFVLSRTVIVADDSWTEELMVSMTLATLREGAETVGTTSNRRVAADLSVDGGQGYAMNLTTDTDGIVQTMAMTTFARPLDNGDVVGVMCLDLETVDPKRCEELSPWYAVELPDVPWIDVSKPTQFVGRTINAPPGCALDDENMVICAGTGSELIWYEQHPDDPPGTFLSELKVVHDAMVRLNRERTKVAPQTTEQGFDCHIDGEVGDCKLYSYAFAGNVLYVLVGVAEVRGVDVGVLCDWTSDVTDEIPVPCSLIVDPNPADGTQEL